jgi:5,10-methenyltetrahydrofolate synthetase
LSEASFDSSDAGRLARRQLRQRLLADRDAFLASAAAEAATVALEGALRVVVAELEPTCLGLYWPFPSEFNAARALGADARFDDLAFALPFARRTPKAMEFRRWNRAAPTVKDECGIGSCDGAAVVPDVLVVPCVGFTAAGHRLGYGGGYYDRWLAAHPDVTAVGVGWSFAELDLAAFAARPHDIPLSLVVTERGVR